MDVGTFCERSVDVMGEESDHIHAQALADAMQVRRKHHQLSSKHGCVSHLCLKQLQRLGAVGGLPTVSPCLPYALESFCMVDACDLADAVWT
jgi:hypothetical protein